MLQQTESHPYASLLISAYNEQTFIEDKILNSLQLNYPKTQLEVMVVSDGSDDRTDEIVRSYERQGIVLQRFEGRIGKTACLNKAVSLARGEIIIFSDANAQYDQNAVKELTKHFSDSKIGFVTGHTKYIGEQNDKVKQSVGIYSKLERFAKNSESKIGSCVGADGAIFAIRKILYKELSSQDINDLVIPFHILKQGFRGILEQRAFCFEKAPKGISAEFSRQVRIANRTIRAILNNFQLANPFHYGLFAWQLLSHKLLKLLVPFFLLILLMTSLFLSSDKPFYFLVFMGQIITYLLALIGFVQYKLLKSSKLTSIATTFTVANLAILTGWMTYLRGDKNITWKVSR
ncbi:MAG: glycosyltransferase family 2 protein [Deltaproteobacteria bacterium]